MRRVYNALKTPVGVGYIDLPPSLASPSLQGRLGISGDSIGREPFTCTHVKLSVACIGE